MRLAFLIQTADTKNITIKFFSATDVSLAGALADPVTGYWSRTDKGLKCTGWASPMIAQYNRRIMKAIDMIDEDGAGTPLTICRAILEEMGCQVVWDSKLSKYRNVATAKNGEDTYRLFGVDGLSVDASDEDLAMRLAKKMITGLMVDTPEKAEELAKWFSAGCKITKVASGSLPTWLELSTIAAPGEESLAKQPIKVVARKPRSKKEEDDKDD